MKLNANQLKAIEHTHSTLLVIAAAGSGKTRVITQKIAHLIKNKYIHASKILAVTFTNKAAAEMKERLSNIMYAHEFKGIRVSTFHSFGLEFLRKEIKILGFSNNVSLFDSTDCLKIISDLMSLYTDDIDTIKLAVNQVHMWKNTLVDTETAYAISRNQDQHFIAKVYDEYQQFLKACNAVDFDDLILLPVHILKNFNSVRIRWQEKISYLLVDEYQDTNLSQYELIKLLTTNGNMTVVGDDDQSIYAFRGARPENLTTLSNDFSDLQIIALEQNYRSTNNILNCANKIIDNNPHLFNKTLYSQFGNGAKVEINGLADSAHEYNFVANKIIELNTHGIASYDDIAILYRSKHQARDLELALKTVGIDYCITDNNSLFENEEIKDILAYLKLIANNNDNNALTRIINIPKRGIGIATVTEIANYAADRSISMLEAINDLDLKFEIKNYKQEIENFANMFMQMQKMAQEDPILLINTLIDLIKYEEYLALKGDSEKQIYRKLQNISILLKQIGKIYERDNVNSLKDALDKMLLRELLREDNDDIGMVKLMTLHSSKGLEFPIVFIISCEENIIPHVKSIEQDNIYEERRLMYVGITRAKTQLYVSYALKRNTREGKISTSVSRFLEELPQESILWNTYTEENCNTQKHFANAAIDNILAILE